MLEHMHQKSSICVFGLSCFLILLVTFPKAFSLVHPISVKGNYFLDSVTNEPFYIKGVDYQPGGSSGVSDSVDPLSDPQTCARDILLFQDLGINTIRVYSINPELNHDICMTMLAAAGIYLVLDVNSPSPNQHINRYEPWLTYNLDYLEHVFKVVEQFSYYNNTLGFFAGNEIVNDRVSSKNSPVYIKAVIRDMKSYIEYNSPRQIPVGYSAADDLSYRVSLSDYLECIDEHPNDSVDFYGVNSYQWCGEQTFYTSGYNVLVDDYSSYSRPVFFSEYGCNEVTPRQFEEVQALYSNDMIDVFSGGLIYEFTQEPNNYGLVEIEEETGNVKLKEDYLSLKSQFQQLPELDHLQVNLNMKKNAKEAQNRLKASQYSQPRCSETYQNLDVSKGLPKNIADGLIEAGVQIQRGQYVNLKDSQLKSGYSYTTSNGKPYSIKGSIQRVVDYSSYSSDPLKKVPKDFENCMYDNDLIHDYDEEIITNGNGSSIHILPKLLQTIESWLHKFKKSNT
ncbi:1,3-beta-glucanosyltransferase Gas4p [[Candida] railenensis]|uniref:1,3-beta-glucanosyltransferase n=1 Tax=[Candida] railenensis TaxID=45579 RepID=A0A9P0QPI6_9ASCO|nr:1,3-beta-glucanosyltransferase Gas4p [[Candida] railenensis]